MRAVVQRVTSAAVEVDGQVVGAIGHGLLVLLGVAGGDDQADVDYMVRKLAGLRIFPDEAGRMCHDLTQVGGGLLLVPQFTLFGDLRRGNRPAFTGAAPPELGQALYEAVLAALRHRGLTVAGGRFRETMAVSLVNDGPVTILLDSSRLF